MTTPREVRKQPMTEDEIRALPATTDPETAFNALGIGRTRGYALLNAGEFPVPVLRIGSRYKVPKAPLLRYLGIETDESDHTDDTPHPTSNGQAGVSRPVSRVLDFSDTPGSGVVMRNRRGRVKVIYADDMYSVGGKKVSGADIIARGYIHPEVRR